MKILKSPILYAFAILLVTGVFAYAEFPVGITFINSKPVTLVDEFGEPFGVSNPLPSEGTTAPISGFFQGRKSVTTAGVPEPIVAIATPFSRCILTGYESNTDVLVFGDATVDASLATRDGLPIYAMEKFTLSNGDLNDLFVDVEVNGEGITYYCES